jgi:hypothetical protein
VWLGGGWGGMKGTLGVMDDAGSGGRRWE